MSETKIYLPTEKIPKQWYNVLVDIKDHIEPPLNPQTGKPLEPADLKPIFPEGLIEQEVSSERWIPIPEEIREEWAIWRPTPLIRAKRLEEYLQTPAKIYYKNEGVSPPGSHKPNTAIAQAYYNKREGIKRLTTETGAGQWGSALAYACHRFGLECMVYMVRCSYEQKPFRKTLIRLWNGKIAPSPSELTEAGRRIREQFPDTTGSLGIAISEAVEDAATREDSHYTLGSVLNHVLLHQTVIGLELKEQLKIVGDYPDVIVGCCGGGSNFGGIILPFVPDKLEGKDIKFIGVEPTSCPTMTKGVYAYDYGDTAKLTPLLKMYTLGHDFIPPAIHAGGLRYHGMAPIVSTLVKMGVVEPISRHQTGVFEAAKIFAETEGFVGAPETAHAIKVVIDEAIKAKETGEPKVIVFNFSGHGHFDMAAYEAYFDNKLTDYEYPEEAIKQSMEKLPKVS